jgi:hypothetical protein
MRTRHEQLRLEKEELKSFLSSAYQGINDLKDEIKMQTVSFRELEEKSKKHYDEQLDKKTKKEEALESELLQLKRENAALTQQNADFEIYMRLNPEKVGLFALKILFAHNFILYYFVCLLCRRLLRKFQI